MLWSLLAKGHIQKAGPRLSVPRLQRPQGASVLTLSTLNLTPVAVIPRNKDTTVDLEKLPFLGQELTSMSPH